MADNDAPANNDEAAAGHLYSVLNVPRDASTSQLRSAYKRLTLLLHPDRHHDPVDAEHANTKFKEITRAHETLMDPTKRALYDKYGEAGLKRTRQFGETDMDMELHKRTTALKGSSSILLSTVDRRKPPYRHWTGLVFPPEVLTISTQQLLEVKPTHQDTFTIGGSVQLHDALGQLILGYRREISYESSAWAHLTTSLDHYQLQIGTLRRLSPQHASHVQLSTNISDSGASVTLSYQRLVTRDIVGLAAVTFGEGAAVELVAQQPTPNSTVTARLRLDMSHALSPAVILQGEKRLSASTNGELTCYLSAEGPQITLGITRELSGRSHDEGGPDHPYGHRGGKSHRIGMSVGFGMWGVRWQLLYKYYHQRFELPILIAQESTFLNVIGALLMPAVALLIAKFCVIDPRRRKRERRHRTKQRRRYVASEEYIRARQEAESTLARMRRELEERTRVMAGTAHAEPDMGLHIISARYGLLDEDSPLLDIEDRENMHARYPMWIDVSVALQHMVADNELHLFAGPKHDLPGFYDVWKGEPKKLEVKYLFRQKIHEITINEEDPLELPYKSHLASEMSE